EDSELEIDFPESVDSQCKGELGTPAHGFPEEMQNKVLKGTAPLNDRPGAVMPLANLAGKKAMLENMSGKLVTEQELASYLMYPKVFTDFMQHDLKYGAVSSIPSSAFFYGLKEQSPVEIELDRGKILEIKLLGRSEAKDGVIDLFVELNGQLRL